MDATVCQGGEWGKGNRHREVVVTQALDRLPVDESGSLDAVLSPPSYASSTSHCAELNEEKDDNA